MPSAELCTEDEIVELVYRFYDRFRVDAVLGPIFEKHVKDWDAHMPTMVDFWSSALRGTGQFRGAPMPKHAALPGLTAELFQRWLMLFAETTDALPNTALGQRAQDLSKRVAQSLWYGYQMSHDPERLAKSPL